MVKVKLYSALRNYGGPEIMIEHKGIMTLRNILDELEIPIGEISVIILNNVDSTPYVMLDRMVKDDSIIHLFPPIAGG